MSDLTLTSDWTDSRDGHYLYAETNDPRILAVVAQDMEPSAPDYDAQAPTLMTYDWGRRSEFTPVGSDDGGGVRDAWLNARRHFGDQDIADRFVRIFHDAEVYYLRSYVDQYTGAVVFNTPAWREAVGAPDDAGHDDLVGDVQAYLDNDVYGIGYAVMPERVTTETPVDFGNYAVSIEVWGYYGLEYAKEAAAAFEAGEPENVPELLELTVNDR